MLYFLNCIRVCEVANCVTNPAASVDAPSLSHEEVFEAGRKVEQRLARLLERLAPRIAALQEA